MFDWGSVLAKTPEKRKYLMEIFPDNKNYIIKVLSCQILKEWDRHGETDLFAEVKVNACTPDKAYQFISEFEEASVTTLSTHRGDKTFNGPKASLSGVRFCHHNVKETNTKNQTNKQEKGKQTNCPSQYNFRLSPCKQAEAEEIVVSKEEKKCKCLCFKVKNIHNHIVQGGESSKWHKVSNETKKLFENYFERKLSPQGTEVSDLIKDMLTIFGQDFTFLKKKQCTVLITLSEQTSGSESTTPSMAKSYCSQTNGADWKN